MTVSRQDAEEGRLPGWARWGRYGVRGRFPAAKRVLDLAVLLLASPFWVPLLVVVAVLVRVRLGAPVFFRQERTGLGGTVFRMVKFRSMTDAAGPDGNLLPDAERLTPFGRWLRSTSLDELPELLCIVSARMSLVGPRPLLPRYLPRYSESQRVRHDLPAGLTGWAQVNGRNALTWDEKFRQDAWYVRNAGVGLDLWILWRTVAGVLRREGISAAGEATMPEFLGGEEPQMAQMAQMASGPVKETGGRDSGSPGAPDEKDPVQP